MANISRDLWVSNNEEIKHYDQAVLQMGVPMLDADFNVAQDIRRWQDRRMVRELVGNGVILDTFKIMENSVPNGGSGDINQNFLIQIADSGTYPGLVFINGWIGRFETLQDYKNQTDWKNWSGSGEPAPLCSNYAPAGFPAAIKALTTPGIARADEVFVCLWEYEVDSTIDVGIKDPTLAVETCRRKKVMVFIGVAEGGTTPASDATHQYFHLATINRLAADATITDAMITDTRGYPSRGIIDISTEVITARGSVGTLDTRLSVSLMATGRLKDACLNANWDVGDYQIRAKQLYADVPVGTTPLLITSTTKVSNLNVDQVDGVDLPAVIASVLTDHNKAAHDTLGIAAATAADAALLQAQNGAYYLARANHTGTQSIGTLSDHNTANHDSLNITPGNGTVTNAKLNLTGLALTSPLTMGGSNITGVGDLGTSGAKVTNAYISTLYLGDLNLLNGWKLDDKTDELIWINPKGKRFKMILKEIK